MFFSGDIQQESFKLKFCNNFPSTHCFWVDDIEEKPNCEFILINMLALATNWWVLT